MATPIIKRARDTEPLQPGHAAQVGRVDVLTHAVAVARDQRGEHAIRQHDGAHLIRNPAGDGERRHVGLARRQHDPGARLRHVVERRRPAVRALRAVAGSAGVDQLRVVLRSVMASESEPRGHALAKVLDEDIGLRHELVHDLTPAGVFRSSATLFLLRLLASK